MDNEIINEIGCHNLLLGAWEEKFPTDIYHFNRDGIISAEHWGNCFSVIFFTLALWQMVSYYE